MYTCVLQRYYATGSIERFEHDFRRLGAGYGEFLIEDEK
jgi:hypothetical protein